MLRNNSGTDRVEGDPAMDFIGFDLGKVPDEQRAEPSLIKPVLLARLLHLFVMRNSLGVVSAVLAREPRNDPARGGGSTRRPQRRGL